MKNRSSAFASPSVLRLLGDPRLVRKSGCRISWVLGLLGFGAADTAWSQAAPPPIGNYQVTVTDLGLLPGGHYASAYAINDTGMVAGVASDANGQLRTVRWIDGQIVPIAGLAPSAVSVPSDMNDAGEMSGRLAVDGQNTGIFWTSAGQPLALQGLPGTNGLFERANGINAHGLLVGRASEGPPNLYAHAALWQGANFVQDLGFLGGGTYSEAFGVNDVADVVGVATLANQTPRAFLYRNGQYTDLGTWSGASVTSRAFAINNFGEIVGLNNNVAARFTDGVVEALPMPPGVSAFTPATDINDAGDAIATGTKLFPIDVGVVWRQGQPLELPPLPGGTISRARHINQAGEVVGESNTADGFFHAVKWTVTALDWSDVGQALQGEKGLPHLNGAGELVGGGSVSWTLFKARANAPTWFVAGVSALQLPLAGGVLVPDPVVLVPVTTTAGGTARVQLALPPTLPPGLDVYVQAWILDASGSQGWAATNGVLATSR